MTLPNVLLALIAILFTCDMVYTRRFMRFMEQQRAELEAYALGVKAAFERERERLNRDRAAFEREQESGRARLPRLWPRT